MKKIAEKNGFSLYMAERVWADDERPVKTLEMRNKNGDIVAAYTWRVGTNAFEIKDGDQRLAEATFGCLWR